MKKLSLVLSIVLMMCIMVACGSGEPATIIDNEGNTVQMTADELKAVYDENTERFEDLYKGAAIELIGTVERVDGRVVELKEGWDVELGKSWRQSDVLESLNAGDKVYVKSNILSATFVNVDIGGCKKYGYYSDDTLKKTVLRTVDDQEAYVNEFTAAYEALSDKEKDFFDSYADELKEYVQDEGAGDYTAIHAWSKDSNYTYLYLEYQQPGSIWMKVDMSEDGKTFTAHNPDSLNIPDGTEPLLDDYEAVQDVINLYLYM